MGESRVDMILLGERECFYVKDADVEHALREADEVFRSNTAFPSRTPKNACVVGMLGSSSGKRRLIDELSFSFSLA